MGPTGQQATGCNFSYHEIRQMVMEIIPENDLIVWDSYTFYISLYRTLKFT